MKIEFGCGKDVKEGFVGSDIRALDNVKYVCECWNIHKYVENNSVDEIFSRHMFEHLTFKQGRNALVSWKKVLKVGGSVRIIVPNLKYHIDEYLRFYTKRNTRKLVPSFTHAIASIYGWQRENESSDRFTSDENLWDVHKSGYDEISIKELSEECGYSNFKRNEARERDLDVVFYKK